MGGIGEARIEAEELGVSAPPILEDLEQLALPAALALKSRLESGIATLLQA